MWILTTRQQDKQLCPAMIIQMSEDRRAPAKPFLLFIFPPEGSWLSLSRMDRLNGTSLYPNSVSGD